MTYSLVVVWCCGWGGVEKLPISFNSFDACRAYAQEVIEAYPRLPVIYWVCTHE